MAKGDTVTGLIGLITALLTLLKPNEKRQNNRILIKSFKNYKKIRRIMKKNDGKIDTQEAELLKELMHKIITAQFELLNI